MHALIVTAHPECESLTNSVATEIMGAAANAYPDASFELADLATEGFDPRFTRRDLKVHRSKATPPSDVVAEQARIDRADTLVLVYPVYWWSMPALLKGWIDRVFANGWAFDFSLEAKLTKNLGELRVHLVALGGSDQQAYARHGYLAAMRSQIDHGIFDYCGATVETSKLFFDSETADPDVFLVAARALGSRLFEREQVVSIVLGA